MQKRYVSLVAAIVILLLLAGCSPKPSPLSPQDQFLMKAEKVYVTQYNDYLAMAQNPNLTEDQKKVLRVKKQVLVQLEPLIKLYRSTLETGGIPSADTEQQIMNLLNQIGGAL